MVCPDGTHRRVFRPDPVDRRSAEASPQRARRAEVGQPEWIRRQQEQQADCFGAWTAHVTKGGTAVKYAPGDLETAMQGFIGFGDRPGYAANLPGAHGNAFDRVAAFQDGFERDATKCVAYANSAPPMTEKRYGTVNDMMHQGNTSWDEAIPLLKASLNDYWTAQGQASAVVLRSESTDPAQTCPSGHVCRSISGFVVSHLCPRRRPWNARFNDRLVDGTDRRGDTRA